MVRMIRHVDHTENGTTWPGRQYVRLPISLSTTVLFLFFKKKGVAILSISFHSTNTMFTVPAQF